MSIVKDSSSPSSEILAVVSAVDPPFPKGQAYSGRLSRSSRGGSEPTHVKIASGSTAENQAAPLLQEEESQAQFFKLFMEFFPFDSSLSLKDLLENLEKNFILKALERSAGNQKKAARLLGLKYTTFNEKVKKYRIRFKKKSFPFNS